ncbi:MAG: exopolysaccharide biosynthesis polyprenyl glycosylphosphotransferase [Fusobacteriaceae bacterium]
MKCHNNRYYSGMFLVLLQYIIIKACMMVLGVEKEIGELSFLIYIFFYFKEGVYYFESYLIWEELDKQTRSLWKYLVVITLVGITIDTPTNLWRYYILGIFTTVLSFVLTIIMRRQLFKIIQTKMVIIGTGENALKMKNIVQKNKFAACKFLGFLDANEVMKEEKMISENEIIGNYNNFDLNGIDEVIIALPDLTYIQMGEIVKQIEGKVKKIKFIPRINRMYTLAPKIHDYDGVLLISAEDNHGYWKSLLMKRALDMFIGTMGMLLLIPLSILVWFKTSKEDRKGGIFYSQIRIGLNGKPIKIYKYRSMVHGAEKILKDLIESDPTIREEYKLNKKLKNDPRVTKIGEFLRHSSLDEFPQFFNIIKGEMSFVGPRPYLFEEKPDMGEYFDKIIQVKPGITGMWQTHGRSDTDFEARLEMDQYYYRNWSVWLDVIIMIETIKDVFIKKGAY